MSSNLLSLENDIFNLIFRPDKKNFPMLKKYIFSCEMDGKWVFSHEQNFFMAKKSFPNHFTSKYKFFSLGKKICLDKKYFVQADGWDINIVTLQELEEYPSYNNLHKQ